jgi:hypothetical protein
VIIAGLTGGIGHGKTTFASLLAARSRAAIHFESWEIVAEVATALKDDVAVHPEADDLEAINEWLLVLPEIVEVVAHVKLSYLDIKVTPERIAEHPEYFEKLFEYLRAVTVTPALGQTAITAETKEDFRPLLQWLGGYLVAKGGPGVWYDEIIRRIGHARSGGCDLVTVGGVRYPGDAERLRNAGGLILEISRPSQPTQDQQDITERERRLIEPDSLIINASTLTDLESCAQTVYDDMVMRRLKPEYQSA